MPVYLELLSGVVAGVIDTVWVSRLGEAAAGAVAVATTLENVLLGVILMAGVFKGTGDTGTPMRTAILANALILVLDPLLIHGVGPLPHLGVRGAALGMLVGRAIALCVSLTILRRKRLTDAGDAEPTDLRLWNALRRLLDVGLPASGDFVLRMGIGMTLVGIVARFGEDPPAAYGIGFKVLFFVTMAFYAGRQAASILTARTRGAGAPAESMIGRQSVVLATLVGAGAGFPLALGGRFLMGLFSDAPGVVDSGGVLFRYLFPYLPLLAGVVGLGGVFTGGGRSRALFWVTLLGAVVQIPLALALSSWSVLGLEGFWLSMIFGTGAQYAMSYALFRRHFARTERRN
ncbi:MATE family efflux transporter [Streptomyces sp. A1277]|nr:MATE family efflux transporter [Streptomyces sp. A1277]